MDGSLFSELTKSEFHFETARQVFALNRTNWIEKSRIIANCLKHEYPTIYEGYRYVEGARILCRNIALVLMTIGVIRVFGWERGGCCLSVWPLLIVGSVIFIMISGYISFYYQLALINCARVIISKNVPFKAVSDDTSQLEQDLFEIFLRVKAMECRTQINERCRGWHSGASGMNKAGKRSLRRG